MDQHTRRLCEASKSVCRPVANLCLSEIRSVFANLMDECANAVTMEHGLDLDDVIMERFARANGPSISVSIEIPIPFLADEPGLTKTINDSVRAVNGSDGSTQGLSIEELIVRVFLETDAPLFNQAGAGGDANAPKRSPDCP